MRKLGIVPFTCHRAAMLLAERRDGGVMRVFEIEPGEVERMQVVQRAVAG